MENENENDKNRHYQQPQKRQPHHQAEHDDDDDGVVIGHHLTDDNSEQLQQPEVDSDFNESLLDDDDNMFGLSISEDEQLLVDLLLRNDNDSSENVIVLTEHNTTPDAVDGYVTPNSSSTATSTTTMTMATTITRTSSQDRNKDGGGGVGRNKWSPDDDDDGAEQVGVISMINTTKKRSNPVDGDNNKESAGKQKKPRRVLLVKNDVAQQQQHEPQQQQQQSNNNNTVSTNNDSVSFGLVNNPATKRWRAIIKEFSDNRIKYPRWNKNICEQVRKRLKGEGIAKFCVPDNDDNNNNNGVKSKKRNNCDNWRIATNEEVLDKTKQRFADDRKKRRNNDAAKADLKNETNSNTEQSKQAEKAAASNAAACHQHSFPSATTTTTTAAASSYRNVIENDRNTLMVRPPPPLAINRQFVYPIARWSVCFEWYNHPGTIQWQDVVRTFASNTQTYPTWKDTIVDQIAEKLAEETNTTSFLVFLHAHEQGHHRQRCTSIHNGLWYHATDDEILEFTKVQFEFERRCRLKDPPNNNNDDQQQNNNSDDKKNLPSPSSSDGSSPYFYCHSSSSSSSQPPNSNASENQDNGSASSSSSAAPGSDNGSNTGRSSSPSSKQQRHQHTSSGCNELISTSIITTYNNRANYTVFLFDAEDDDSFSIETEEADQQQDGEITDLDSVSSLSDHSGSINEDESRSPRNGGDFGYWHFNKGNRTYLESNEHQHYCKNHCKDPKQLQLLQADDEVDEKLDHPKDNRDRSVSYRTPDSDVVVMANASSLEHQERLFSVSSSGLSLANPSNTVFLFDADDDADSNQSEDGSEQFPCASTEDHHQVESESTSNANNNSLGKEKQCKAPDCQASYIEDTKADVTTLSQHELHPDVKQPTGITPVPSASVDEQQSDLAISKLAQTLPAITDDRIWTPDHKALYNALTTVTVMLKQILRRPNANSEHEIINSGIEDFSDDDSICDDNSDEPCQYDGGDEIVPATETETETLLTSKMVHPNNTASSAILALDTSSKLCFVPTEQPSSMSEPLLLYSPYFQPKGSPANVANLLSNLQQELPLLPTPHQLLLKRLQQQMLLLQQVHQLLSKSQLEPASNFLQSPPPKAMEISKTNEDGINVDDRALVVHFGWSTHPATKMWRNVVKIISDDCITYPRWSKDVCDQVKARLEHYHGIRHFDVVNREKGKLLLHRPTTDQEVLENTKRRFLDDRRRRKSLTLAPVSEMSGKKCSTQSNLVAFTANLTNNTEDRNKGLTLGKPVVPLAGSPLSLQAMTSTLTRNNNVNTKTALGEPSMVNTTACTRYRNGWTALHHACSNGDMQSVISLLQHQASPNEKKEDGWTPLHCASQKGHTAVAALLLQHQANPNEKDFFYGWTPLHCASQHGRKAVAALLLQHQANPNERNGKGETPLHWASQNGHEAVAALLLQYKASPNETNNNGETPRDVASRMGHDAVVTLLSQHDYPHFQTNLLPSLNMT